MDHKVSTKTQAAERYLLGELQPPEREEFEQHFFSCPECAEDVRLGFQLSEHAKAVFREQAHQLPVSARTQNRLNWFASIRPAMLWPMAAGLAIAAFSGYQNLMQIPALHSRWRELQLPQMLSSAVLMPSLRSSVTSIAIPPVVNFFQLSLAVGAVAPADGYRCDLRSEDGRLVASIPLSRLSPDENITLLIPTDSVPAGYYDAVLLGLTGGTATKLDEYRFAVRRE